MIWFIVCTAHAASSLNTAVKKYTETSHVVIVERIRTINILRDGYWQTDIMYATQYNIDIATAAALCSVHRYEDTCWIYVATADGDFCFGILILDFWTCLSAKDTMLCDSQLANQLISVSATSPRVNQLISVSATSPRVNQLTSVSATSPRVNQLISVSATSPRVNQLISVNAMWTNGPGSTSTE